MAYNSPLIVSTSSLNPSFSLGGTIAGCPWPYVVVVIVPAVAIYYAFGPTTPVPVFVVVIAAFIAIAWALWKATYVRPI